MTSIYKNPFHLLNATTRDNRRRIVELYEEKSLLLDSDICSKAKSDLTNPRIRLSAEISWLPGISPKRTIALVELLNNNPVAIKNQNNIPPLALANLLAASLETLKPEIDLDNWAEYILILVKTVNEISADDVLRDVNEDRAIAGFPEVKSLEWIEQELAKRRSYYKSAIKGAINQLPTIKLVEVMTEVVEVSTHNGEVHAPMLIDALVDSYETETRSFLQKESENVLELVESAKQAAPRGEDAVGPILNKLDTVVRNWDKVAQPIQVSMKSRGLNHDMSHELAHEIRNLGVELTNEYNMLEATRQVTETLQEVFAELPEVISQLDEDASAIEKLFVERDEAQSNYEEWAKKITFSADIGWFFKNTLAISPEGVWWKNLYFPLNKITRVRWGVTKNYTNHIPTGTTYNICFGDNRRMAIVDPGSSGVYEQFVDKLWHAVCVRILNEMLVGLKNGSRYEFGDAVVDDYGVEVTKRKFFSSVRVYGKWAQIRIDRGNGSFILGIDSDKNAYSEMPYQEVDNVHILETAMRMFFKMANTRLSSLLKR